MPTIHKMMSEVRELGHEDWDAVGGMGGYGPSQEGTVQNTSCPITGTYQGQYFTANDDGTSDTGYD